MATTDASAGFGIAIIAGFAVQRVIEIIDYPLEWMCRGNLKLKKFSSATIATVLGCLISLLAKIDVLGAVVGSGVTLDRSAAVCTLTVHVAVTGLSIGSGTEGVNSMLKYASYAKQD